MEHLIKVMDLCKIYNPGENEVRALDQCGIWKLTEENLLLLSGSPVQENQHL